MPTYDYDVYRDELRALGHGLPVYEPNPCRYDRVRIGDVGVITEHGYFERCFNVFFSSDDPINDRFGVPEDFERADDSHMEDNNIGDLIEGSQLKSTHVQSIEVVASVQVEMYGCI